MVSVREACEAVVAACDLAEWALEMEPAQTAEAALAADEAQAVAMEAEVDAEMALVAAGVWVRE